jgi:cell division protein FtsI (penicillin-binding protein 3)
VRSPRRLTAAFVALAVIFGGFFVRLVWLQGVDPNDWAVQAASARTLAVTLPAVRGPILDVNGVPLATTVDAVDVIVDQTQMSNPAAAALRLAGPLDRDPADLQAAMTGGRAYVPLARRVDGPVWSSIRAMGIKGIYSEPSADRAYPAGAVAGNILGFIGNNGGTGENEWVGGQSGLEESYEELLAGVPGSLSYERDSAGRAIPLGNQSRVDPVPGAGLRLTIDRDVQWMVERALAAKVAEAKAANGSAIVYDPATGDIVALADVPHVNPEKPGATKREDRITRSVSAPYEPGSVQKVLTMAAVLDAGVAEPDEVFTVPYALQRGGAADPITDFAPHEDWEITLSGILAKSSNVGTMLAADRLGERELRDYLVKFGYGRAPGIGMPHESAGQMSKEWSGITRDTASYGQGISTTIVHLAAAYGAIANDGLRMPPRLVESVVEADGTERSLPHDEPVKVVSAQAAREVTRMMEAVVGPGGTASNVVVDGYRVAGKTGTAQRLDVNGNPVGRTTSFAGFAPADDPQLVVVVSLHDPPLGASGAGTAGPVFADIMKLALPRLGIPPSGSPAPQVPLFADELTAGN